MRCMNRNWSIGLILIAAIPAAYAGMENAMSHYDPRGAAAFSAERGKDLWTRKTVAEDGKERECATCHGTDLRAAGKHAKTGKVIDPMAPSVNKERYGDPEKVEKWFTRNCKWTLGRECTPQEKGDLLKYLAQF
jgi:hypothetical protein